MLSKTELNKLTKYVNDNKGVTAKNLLKFIEDKFVVADHPNAGVRDVFKTAFKPLGDNPPAKSGPKGVKVGTAADSAKVDAAREARKNRDK